MGGIVLASASPRRQELLRRVGLTDFRVMATAADESWDPAMGPEEVVGAISRRKARAALTAAAPGDLIITADTMVFLGEERLGKPRDEAEAFTMLSHLSGREHTVWTGVTVAREERLETEAEATRVLFRPLDPAEIIEGLDQTYPKEWDQQVVRLGGSPIPKGGLPLLPHEVIL